MKRLLMTLAVGMVCSVAPAQDTNMVGRWSFDEGTGTNTVDASGNSHAGTLTGNPLPVWTSGVIAPVGGHGTHALSFDGSQNEVQIPDATGLTPTNALTLTAWVKAATNLTSEIVAKWSTTTNTGSYLLSLTNGLPKLELMLDGQYNAIVGQALRLPDSEWHHIAGTYDGSTINVYLDANLIGSAAASGTVNVVSDPMRIGLLAGTLDDVRLYNTALTVTNLFALWYADSDGDGFPDYMEANACPAPSGAGTNPNDPNSWPSGVSSGAVSKAMSPMMAAFSTLSQQGSMTCITVPSTSGGVEWGCVVQGQTYSYTASGCIKFQSTEPGGSADPDGNVSQDHCVTFLGTYTANGAFTCSGNGIKSYSLVGKINGANCFQLGTSGSFTAAASGTLTLYFNDDVWDDNSLSWDCCIAPLSNSLTFVDAQGFQPQLNGTTPSLQTPITNTVEYSFNRVGALTDGASLIVVQLPKGYCSFEGWTVGITDTTPGSTNGAAQLGSLWDDSYDSDNLPELPATLASPGETNVTLSANTRAIFYRPPPSWAFGSGTTNHNIEIRLADSQGNTVTNQTFALHKPPLVLVHGGVGDPTHWDRFQSILDARGIVVDLVTPFVDYTTNNFSGVDVIYPVIPANISNRVSYLQSQHIAATRLDVIAHSAGGVAARWYMTPVADRPTGPRVDENSPLHEGTQNTQILPLLFKTTNIHDTARIEFRRAENFGIGDIRRLITLGAPHRGMTVWKQVIRYFNAVVEHTVEGRRAHRRLPQVLELAWGFRLYQLDDPHAAGDQGMMMLDLAAFAESDTNGTGRVSRVIAGLPPVQVLYAPIEGIAEGGGFWGDLGEKAFEFLFRWGAIGGLPVPADTHLNNSDGVVPAHSARNLSPVDSFLKLDGRSHTELGAREADDLLAEKLEQLLGPTEEHFH